MGDAGTSTTYTSKGKPFERDMDYISDRVLAGERSLMKP